MPDAQVSTRNNQGNYVREIPTYDDTNRKFQLKNGTENIQEEKQFPAQEI
jgi:hypothetical protein